MSLVLALKQAPDETLELLIDRPELAIVFWMNPDQRRPKTPALLVWIAKLLGHYEPPLDLPEAPGRLVRNGEELRLDRFVETLIGMTGDPPITESGAAIQGSDHGNGEERALTAKEVVSLSNGMRYESRPTEHDDLTSDLTRLEKFIRDTAQRSLGLVVQLS